MFQLHIVSFVSTYRFRAIRTKRLTALVSLPDLHDTKDSTWCTDAACKISDNCQVQIPFSGKSVTTCTERRDSRSLAGSGITIYVLQAGAQGINASLTIDEGAPTYNVLPAPPGPSFYIPNVTLFSVQGMTTGNHTATMTVLNWDNIFSGMMFDYAWINQTVVDAVSTATTSSVTSSTATSTSSPTSMATSTPSKSTYALLSWRTVIILISILNSTHVGAIVGGIVGGLAALIALFATFYVCRRRRETRGPNANLNPEPTIEPFFTAESLYHQAPQRYANLTSRPASESLVTGTVSGPVPPHSTSSGSSRREKSRLDITNPNPSASQIGSSNVTFPPSQAGLSSTFSSIPSGTSRPQIRQAHPTLTDDQADFVNSLYANNIPAGAIARVIERMIAGEREPAVDGYDSLPPPSYYHGAGDE